jgi:DegV family protein with EDD domain
MPDVAIVTDSVCSIPEEILGALEIHWVPYFVYREAEVLRDLVTIQRDAFYKWLPTAKKLPTTACPGPGDYLKEYSRITQEYHIHNIVSIHMTSKGSGAYQSAKTAQNMAREMLPEANIEVIDTLNASMCHGWMVIEAARAALAGKTFSEIIDLVKRMMPVTRMIHTADTLKYLYMGGRIGKAKHLMGSLLNIKPLIGMEDGIIVALGQARSRSQAYQFMVNKLESVVASMGNIKVAYVHAAALEEVSKLRTKVEQRLNCTETIISELSPALGVYTGPGTCGLSYYPVSALQAYPENSIP